MTKREVLASPRMYVGYWASKRKVVRSTDYDEMFLDYIDEINDYNIAHRDDKKPVKHPVKHVVESAFNLYLRGVPKMKREAIGATLKTTGEDLSELKKWLEAVTGKLDDDDLYVMAHWVWLVKRNMFEKSVVHHIMPLLVSPIQGGGKSTAVKRLLVPVDQLSLELKVTQIVEERSFTMFSNYLVGFLDELAGAGKIDISDFKRNVTSSSLTYRPMRTNSQETIPNLCSFIGASNNEIYEIIKDTTGTRRFFPVKTLNLLNHAAINSIDYDKLWKGIDENKDRGYFEKVQKSVTVKQEAQTMKDEIVMFLEEHSLAPNDSGKTEVNGKQLYREYILYANMNGIRFPVAAQTFYKKLKDLGFEGVKRKDASKVLCWYFSVNAEHGINSRGEQ